MAATKTATAIPEEFSEALEVWLHTNDFSEKTITAYRLAATKMMLATKPWRPKSWALRVIEWRKSLKDHAIGTQMLYVAGARQFLIYCIEEGLIQGKNPLASVHFRGSANTGKKKRSLTDSEVRALIETCNEKRKTGLRDKCILMLSLHTAIRIGGISNVNIEDFGSEGDVAIVRYLCKGHVAKDRSKYVPDEVIQLISRYLEMTGRSWKKTGPLFLGKGKKPLTYSGIRKAVARRFHAAGIEADNVSTHCLRHTAATKAIDEGADPVAVQDLLDHSSLATTQIYIHTVRSAKDSAGARIKYDFGGANDE